MGLRKPHRVFQLVGWFSLWIVPKFILIPLTRLYYDSIIPYFVDIAHCFSDPGTDVLKEKMLPTGHKILGKKNPPCPKTGGMV